MSLLAKNPYVFVVGCPRSGTTLLQRMLDNHPQLAVVNDAAFILKTLKAVYPQIKKSRIKDGLNPPLTPEVVDYLLQLYRFARMRLPEQRVRDAAGRCGTLGAFIAALYEEFARRRDKPLAGDKTPDYARRLPILHGIFPQARFIHIIRDGRDVALSTLEWAAAGNKGPVNFALWNEHRMGTIALWWRWLVGRGCRDGAALGPALYHEVRYERLVADPESVLRELADFLGLPFAEEMLRFHEGKTVDAPQLSAKRAWLPPTRGLRDWTSQMRHDDLALCESLAGDLLAELGYPRANGAPDPAVAAAAEYCRNWWFADSVRT